MLLDWPGEEMVQSGGDEDGIYAGHDEAWLTCPPPSRACLVFVMSPSPLLPQLPTVRNLTLTSGVSAPEPGHFPRLGTALCTAIVIAGAASAAGDRYEWSRRADCLSPEWLPTHPRHFHCNF